MQNQGILHFQKSAAILRGSGFLLFAAVMLLYSCKEENYYTDEEFDIKASQMEQIGGLFDAIARQPEANDFLAAVCKKYLNFQMRLD